MNDTLLLDPVRVLRGPGHSVQLGAVLIHQGVLVGFDDEARQQALGLGIKASPAPDQLVAPCLVDPHSILETPFSGDQETAGSLRHCAAAGGYGQIGLLPRSSSWREKCSSSAMSAGSGGRPTEWHAAAESTRQRLSSVIVRLPALDSAARRVRRSSDR